MTHASPQTPILIDGAMGTLLESRGLTLPTPAWSAHAVAHHPDAVQQIHAEYALAGATVHTAATFRTQARHLGDRADELLHRAVQLARAAVPSHHRVAGSLAPLEDCYRPDLSPPDAYAEHAATAASLANAGVDLILVETFAHPDEALVATRAALATGLETWLALTPGPWGDLLTPERLADTATAAATLGADAVLVNCVAARHAMPWVRALSATGVRFGVYANAGASDDGLWHGQPGAPEAYGDLVADWIGCNAMILGGCCGTGPKHIAAIERTVIAGKP